MHLLFTTIGSMGDLHPILAVARAWQRRGHRATVVTLAEHRARVEAAGLAFRPTAPVFEEHRSDAYRRTFDARHGTRVLFTEVLLPALFDSYADLERAIAAERPDGLVANDLALGVSTAASAHGLPWAAAVLQPSSFLSAHDPPVLLAHPWVRRLRRLGPWAVRLAYRSMGLEHVPWPLQHLRHDAGLPGPGTPLLRLKHDADLALALFSRALVPPAPDWPDPTVVCGFPFLGDAPADEGADGLPDDLAAFLAAGPPPVVFTLGDTAARAAGAFFETSVAAARALGARAVLVTGAADTPGAAGDGVHVASYVPYGRLFGRARAVVHAGGIGTIGLALRAGVPQLIVPRVHDQPDNAARAARIGAARTMAPADYTAPAVAAHLRRLAAPRYAAAAEAAARVVADEAGAGAACDALEAMVRAHAETRAASVTSA